MVKVVHVAAVIPTAAIGMSCLAKSSHGFSIVPSLRLHRHATAISSPQVQLIFISATSGNNDNDDFVLNDISDENIVAQLGIPYGQQLVPNTPEEYDTLQQACASAIDETVEKGLQDLQNLRAKWLRDFDRHYQEPLEQAMTLNGMREANKLHHKVDALIGQFLNQTAVSRSETHQLALQDQRRLEALERERQEQTDKERRPPHFGSWKRTNSEWDEWEEDW